MKPHPDPDPVPESGPTSHRPGPGPRSSQLGSLLLLLLGDLVDQPFTGEGGSDVLQRLAFHLSIIHVR